MSPDAAVIDRARVWLEQLYRDLDEQLRSRKSDDELLRRMEWEIRRYQGEMLAAIKAVLCQWLVGGDEVKFLLALDLIGALHVAECAGELERLRDDLRSGRSKWPSSWLALVQRVLDDLGRGSGGTDR